MAFMERRQLFHFTDHEGLPPPLLHAFQQARQGDFSQIQSLSLLFSPEMSIATAFSALTLIECAAPATLMMQLAGEIRERVGRAPFILDPLCSALAGSGLLPAAELALSIYLKDVIGSVSESGFHYALSIRFERSCSELFYGPQPIFDPNDEERTFPDIVGYRHSAQTLFDSLRLHNDHTCAFRRGMPVDLAELAHQLLVDLPTTYDNEEIVAARVLLEAFTGVDLSAFYTDGILNRPQAMLALQALQQETDLASFKSGQRYFFAHLVPT